MDNQVMMRREVSVGTTIRHVTSYLLVEYSQTIRQLSNDPSPEAKREVLSQFIKNVNDCIKSLLKFTKNCKKFKKIKNLYEIAEKMYFFYGDFKYIIDQLYYTSEMCSFYRTPDFSVKSAIETINHKSHSELKNEIYNYSLFLPGLKYEPKEVQAEFIEKYLYNKNLNKEINNDEIYEEVENVLNITGELMQLIDSDDEIKISYRESMFLFDCNRLIRFKIIPFVLANTEESKIISYFCKDIIFSKHHRAFMRLDQTNKLSSKLNEINLMLQNEIQIHCESKVNSLGFVEEPEITLKLFDLKQFIKNFISNNIMPYLFAFYAKKIAKSVKKVSMPIEIDYKDDIVIEYKPNSDILDDELKNNLKISISAMYPEGKIKVVSSVYIINSNPFIYIDNKEEIYSIENFPYEKVISHNLAEFEEIVIYTIYEKLKSIGKLFFKFSFELKNKQKIDCLIENTFFLFSIIVDNYGNISFIDYDYVLGEEKIKIVSEMIRNYIKYNTIDIFEFNYLLFNQFTETYFRFSALSIKIMRQNENFNFYFSLPKFLSNDMTISLCLTCKYLQSPARIEILNSILYFYSRNKSREEITLDFNQWMTLPLMSYSFTVKSFENLVQGIAEIFERNEEFIKNTIELISIYHIENISSAFRRSKDNTVSTVLEGDNLNYFQVLLGDSKYWELFHNLVTKIEMPNHNVIFNIFLNKNALEHFLKIPLQTYSLMESECTSSFNSKDYCLSFYILSKLKTSDLNSIKKVFTELIKKFLHFMYFIVNLVKTNFTSFSQDNSLFISPIFLCFTLTTQTEPRKIFFQFQADVSNPKYYKVWFLPNESIFPEFDNDHNKLINDLFDGNFLEKLQWYFLIDDVYSVLSKNFLSYMVRINTKIEVSEEMINKGIYVFIKDYLSFEIIKKNSISIIIEVTGPKVMNIYSKMTGNQEKNKQIIDAIRNQVNCVNKNDDRGVVVCQQREGGTLIDEVNKIISIIKALC